MEHDHHSVTPPSLPRVKAADLPELDDQTFGTYDLSEPFAAEPPPGWIIAEPIAELSTLPPTALFDQNETTLEDTIPDRPLISPLASMAVLREEYENGNQVFVQQIDWLMEKGYVGIRRTRGDGDCFYRSLAFAYVERILHAQDVELAVGSALSHLESTKPMLEDVGFQPMVFEDFYDTFVDVIKSIVQPPPGHLRLNSASLFEMFNTPEVSNSIVVYLRLLTSANMRLDPESYAPFLFHPEMGEPMNTVEFCEGFVEAVGKEADHVQITALSRALRVNISVAYLDGRARGTQIEVDFVTFDNNEEENEPVRLLYRPGHYDILDSRDKEPLERQ